MSLNVCTSLLERTSNYIVHLSKWIFIHSLFIVRSGSRISRIDKLILVFLLLSKQSESWTLQSLERKSSFEPRFVTRSEYFSYYTRIYERKTRNLLFTDVHSTLQRRSMRSEAKKDVQARVA